LLDEKRKPLQPRIFTELMRGHEESPSRENDGLDDPTLDDYDEEEWYPREND
jgi:hypothetical protein